MTGSAAMPDRIGRFHIRSMLGRGAMGIVYLGQDEEIDRLVAIKLIRADLLDTEERENYLKRFRNEAKIAGRCMHANIVGLYDFAMHDENPYLVMEYIDGIGLQQFFPRGSRRPVHEVIHIALQVLDALHYAHGRLIVHRDIKPANILMMPDLSLKITDFGISRLTSMELTVTPLLIGTPSYMSPEQCLGSALDGRNDLFSLGCVLYELIAGERAFSGVNYTETIFAIVNKPHVPLSQLRDDLPPGFSDAIDRALAKSPDQRHADAASFARILDDIARESRLPRTGMPPVIITDTGRLYHSAAPAGDGVGNRPVEDAQPTVSAPMTATAMVRPAEPALPPEPPTVTPSRPVPAPPPGTVAVPPPGDVDDPDATLRPTALPPLRPVAVSTPLPEPRPAEPEIAAPLPAAPEPAVESPPTVAMPHVVSAPAVAPSAEHPLPDERASVIHPAPAPPPASAAVHQSDPVATGRSSILPGDADNGGTLSPADAVPSPVSRPLRDPTEAGSVSFTPGPHFALPVPVGDAERARIVDCLSEVIGPIAPLLARRAEQPGMSAEALTETLAGFVRHQGERDHFLRLVGRNAA
ncbi:serine/threonine protein kinase [Acetobacteraceae bacterium KSS8]|uniref:non-specific serine/threonine protein kinase n=1 Tax=Endosaccharibacter trunci TaxID=2812733 RepID=A0ABT1W6Z4_9PROT|nr:serine/threonine protein kinase [Acetobacteraceae bacterium KSS8]